MSADNGIYTLITAAPGGGKEYRVAYGSAIENIFVDDICIGSSTCRCGRRGWWPGARLNAACVRHAEYFGKAPVFTNPKDAEAYAQKLEDHETEVYEGKRYGTEYGCVTFDHSDVPFPDKSMASPR